MLYCVVFYGVSILLCVLFCLVRVGEYGVGCLYREGLFIDLDGLFCWFVLCWFRWIVCD